jgi:hypothetical protein
VVLDGVSTPREIDMEFSPWLPADASTATPPEISILVASIIISIEDFNLFATYII